MPPKRGRVEIVAVESEILKSNPMGDPATRKVPVYLPPGYDEERLSYPVVFVLVGFTGRGTMLLNDEAWSETLADRMDRLMGEGKTSPMILVMPDCFTRLGGSQYINSEATGNYEDYVVEELVPWIDRDFRTLAEARHRGVMGKSSGGYGSIVLGMRHPDVFGAVACHSGDMYFDFCYFCDLPPALNTLNKAGGVSKFLEAFYRKPKKESEDLRVMNILAMASCYSPNLDSPAGFDLPCDVETGEMDEEVWARWLTHDPVRLIDKHADALRRMKLLYLDCGTRDEWHLHYGARIFTGKLRQLGIEHVYEEFDDGHMKVSYRFDRSLELLGYVLRT